PTSRPIRVRMSLRMPRMWHSVPMRTSEPRYGSPPIVARTGTRFLPNACSTSNGIATKAPPFGAPSTTAVNPRFMRTSRRGLSVPRGLSSRASRPTGRSLGSRELEADVRTAADAHERQQRDAELRHGQRPHNGLQEYAAEHDRPCNDLKTIQCGGAP